MFLKNTYVYSKVFNRAVLWWRCQVALLGAEDFLAYVGQETQLPFKAERKWKNGDFFKANLREGGREGRVFLFNMVIYRLENLFHYESEVSFLVFSLIMETTEYMVHSLVPVNYRYHPWTCILRGYILLLNQVSCSVKNGETQSQMLEINFQNSLKYLVSLQDV